MRAPLCLIPAALISLATMSPAIAQKAIAGDPWSASLGEAGPDVILYRGEVLLRAVRVSGYLPAWAGPRFGMEGSKLTANDHGAQWYKAVTDNQDATVSLLFDANKCTLGLDSTVVAAGPTEFSLCFPPEAVQAAKTHCFCYVNGVLVPMGMEDKLDTIAGVHELRFEQAQRTIAIRCEGYDLQDRRASGEGFFLVQVINSDGDKATKVTRKIEVEVKEAAAADIPARRAFVSQRPLTYAEAPVKNAGFEAAKALEDWSANPNASVDAAVFHQGKQSAKLVITPDSPTASQVYLSQLIPIQEGGSYRASAWIRTDNVTRGEPNKMQSIGATLILEFANKEGKWFASGGEAPGSFGTQDWRQVTTASLRAPHGAGFAFVYMALRGYGTAWFDDVTLTSAENHVVCHEPLDGAKLADNTPTFRWYYSVLTGAALDLSPSPEFPKDQTITVANVQRHHTTLKDPLQPGKWYWRVRLPEQAVVSQTWSFEQTAPADRDCTPPVIADTSGFIEGANEWVPLGLSDAGGIDTVAKQEDVTQELQLRAQDVNLANGKTVRKWELGATKGWHEGLNQVTLVVTDKTGNSASRTLYFTHAGKLPETVWQEQGGVDTDGKGRFPVGMYGVRLEDMKEIAAGGFDFVHSYDWDGPGTNETAIEYMDAAQKNGLQVVMGFDRQRLRAGDEAFVAERVGALLSHPGLLAWYLYDEPDLPHQYVSPEWLGRYYRLIKKLDPFHPVIVTCANDDAVKDYKDTFDVHWTQVYGNAGWVASRLDKHRADLVPGTPLAAILNCYDMNQTQAMRSGVTPDLAKFQPDARQFRANVFMALAHNSSGLSYWWWGGGSKDFLTVANAPEAWAGLKLAVADVKSLAPVLTAKGDIQIWIEKPAEGVEVHVWEKKLADRTVIIAVNPNEQPCDVTLSPKTLPGDCKVKVLFENRDAEVKGGKLAEKFGGLGVHVYEGR